MERTEKQRKLQLLKEFCASCKIEESELQDLIMDLAYANSDFSYDIYYADGTISRKIEIEKEPLAVKLSGDDGFESSFWLSLKTTFPNQISQGESPAYLKEIPCIAGKEWRLPKKHEMDIVIHRRRNSLETVDKLRRFFCFPKFFALGKSDTDGRFVLFGTLNDGELIGHSPYFPGAYYSGRGLDSKFFWWPVCDAD